MAVLQGVSLPIIEYSTFQQVLKWWNIVLRGEGGQSLRALTCQNQNSKIHENQPRIITTMTIVKKTSFSLLLSTLSCINVYLLVQ